MKSLFALLAAGTLLLAACSAPAAPPEPVEITIDMSEYAFSPNDISLRVGQEVTFVLVNVGQLEHEFMLGREVDMHDGAPSGYETDFFETGGVEPVVVTMMDEGMDMGDDHGDDDHSGFMVEVAPGSEEATISFTVTEAMLGEWEIGCFLLEGVHYNSGMVGTLTVTE